VQLFVGLLHVRFHNRVAPPSNKSTSQFRLRNQARPLHLAAIFLQELSSCGDGRPFGHNIDRSRKVGRGCCGCAGSPLGHHLTQCGLGRGLPLYQVSYWSIQPFGHSCRSATLRIGIALRTIFIRSLVVTRQNINSTRSLSYCSMPKKIK